MVAVASQPWASVSSSAPPICSKHGAGSLSQPWGLQDDQQELLDELKRDMGLTSMRSFYVDHCSQSFGLALQVQPAGAIPVIVTYKWLVIVRPRMHLDLALDAADTDVSSVGMVKSLAWWHSAGPPSAHVLWAELLLHESMTGRSR